MRIFKVFCIKALYYIFVLIYKLIASKGGITEKCEKDGQENQESRGGREDSTRTKFQEVEPDCKKLCACIKFQFAIRQGKE